MAIAKAKAMNYNSEFQSPHTSQGDRILHNDIWLQKARERMNTARGKRASITVINSTMSPETAQVLKQMEKDKEQHTNKEENHSTFKRIQSIPSNMGSTRAQKSKSPPRSRTPEDRKSSNVRLSQVYEKHHHQKLDGDITDPQTWEEKSKQTKFVLGGGKLDNAMEIVEIVNADDPKPEPVSIELEEEAIAELARINSINKCNVWFEAHEEYMSNNNNHGKHLTNTDDSQKMDT